MSKRTHRELLRYWVLVILPPPGEFLERSMLASQSGNGRVLDPQGSGGATRVSRREVRAALAYTPTFGEIEWALDVNEWEAQGKCSCRKCGHRRPVAPSFAAAEPVGVSLLCEREREVLVLMPSGAANGEHMDPHPGDPIPQPRLASLPVARKRA